MNQIRQDRLGTLVNSLAQSLSEAASRHDFFKSRQGTPLLASKIASIPHAAAQHLSDLREHGVPARTLGEPWTQAHLNACMARGCHKSATEHKAFIQDEMCDNIKKGFWVVLPYELIRHLPNLHLSPLGIKEERTRRPRLVVDHTWFGVNAATLPYTPNEAMQFGAASPQILEMVCYADPVYGGPCRGRSSRSPRWS